jgi:hypothetical protein
MRMDRQVASYRCSGLPPPTEDTMNGSKELISEHWEGLT